MTIQHAMRGDPLRSIASENHHPLNLPSLASFSNFSKVISLGTIERPAGEGLSATTARSAAERFLHNKWRDGRRRRRFGCQGKMKQAELFSECL